MEKIRVMSVFGTRPEAIKMAPLVKELEKREEIESIVCVTAQHREMLDQVLETFDIKPDFDLNIMKQGQTLGDITTRALNGLEEVIKESKPDIVLVTAFDTSGLVSIYSDIKFFKDLTMAFSSSVTLCCIYNLLIVHSSNESILRYSSILTLFKPYKATR